MTRALWPGLSGSETMVPREAMGRLGQSMVKFLSRSLSVSRIQIPMAGAPKSSSDPLKSISKSERLLGSAAWSDGYWPMVQCGGHTRYWFALQREGSLQDVNLRSGHISGPGKTKTPRGI